VKSWKPAPSVDERQRQQTRRDAGEPTQRSKPRQPAAELEAGQRSMLDDAAGKLVRMDRARPERDKHQIMRRRSSKTRAKVRDLERGLMQERNG